MPRSSVRLVCVRMNGEVIYGHVNSLPVATPLKSKTLLFMEEESPSEPHLHSGYLLRYWDTQRFNLSREGHSSILMERV